jgi:hypothetical protein
MLKILSFFKKLDLTTSLKIQVMADSIGFEPM